MTDISHELSLQIGHGAEHAAGNHVALDLGEPQFDLIEPRRIRWGEVQMNVGVPGKELLYPLGFVRGEVVGDYMYFLAFGLVDHEVAQKRDELCRGVPRRGLAQHLPGLRVEGRSCLLAKTELKSA